MKVALVTNAPAPYRLKVYEILSKTYKEDFLVIYASKTEPNRHWNLAEYNFQHVFLKENMICKNDGVNFIHNNLDVITHLREFEPDIIITTGFNPTHLYAWVFATIFKKKHIPMTDGWIESERDLSFPHRLVRKIVFKTSKEFIAASKNSSELYKSYKIDNSIIFNSQLCVDNKQFKNDRSFSDRQFDLVFSACHCEGKLPFFFSDIAKNVSKLIPNVKILILGDGPLRKDFLKKLDSSFVKYHYAGFVSQNSLPKYYGNSKLLLFTTQLDAWGIVANEAMASGTPVFSTPKAGIVNDLLIDNYNGRVLDTDSNKWAREAIEILTNKGKWNKFSNNSLKHIQNYNSTNAANGITNACNYVYNKKAAKATQGKLNIQ